MEPRTVAFWCQQVEGVVLTHVRPELFRYVYRISSAEYCVQPLKVFLGVEKLPDQTAAGEWLRDIGEPGWQALSFGRRVFVFRMIPV